MKNKDITLVILAAGMGSRFGGLKQIEPMGPNGEFIIDYSIYDALEAGFNKVVFLIKEENFDIFKETIGARVEPHIKVEYAFQKNDNVPLFYDELKDRHNADDFYGKDAFMKGAEFLKGLKDEMPHRYGMVGYLVKNTITENGNVKRGICNVENGYLTKLTESSVGRIEDGTIKAKPLDETLEEFDVSEDDTVSMNMLLFDPSIFDYLDSKFKPFLEKNADKLDNCEFLIPDVLFDSINEGFATCEVIPTTSTWYGVTYKEDAPAVKESIKALVRTEEGKEGDYPLHLWD